MQTTAPIRLSPPKTLARRRQVSAAVVPAGLAALGTASLWLYFWGRDLHRFTQGIASYIGLFIVQLLLYVLACYIVERWCNRSSLAARRVTIVLIFFFAAGYRAVLVAQRPYLSTDVYRYVWDGRVQAAGINPYRYVPEATELSGLRDGDVFPNLNREDRNWLTPYPPVAQMFFLAVSWVRPMSVTALKAAVSSFDLITVFLLMLVLARSGIDPAQSIIFAWHPLVIFEGAHSGHFEAIYITFLVLALFAWSHRRHALTGAALAVATLVKFYPAILLPVFFLSKGDPSPRDSSIDAPNAGMAAERVRAPVRAFLNRSSMTILGVFLGSIVLAYLPYLGAGSNLFGFVRGYFFEEGFGQSGSRYFLLTVVRKLIPVPTAGFLIAAVVVFAVTFVRLSFMKNRHVVELARGASALIGLYLLVTTPRYSWYYILIIPFLCFAPSLGWLYLTCASVLLYLVWYTPLVYPGIPLWLGVCIYFPALVLQVSEHLTRRRATVMSRCEVSLPL